MGTSLLDKNYKPKPKQQAWYLVQKHRLFSLISRTRKEMSIDSKVWGFWPVPYDRKKRLEFKDEIAETKLSPSADNKKGKESTHNYNY